jgi:DNA-binding response OmpR family regulator
MSYRILLVDPNRTTQSISASALVRADYRVAAVSTFEQAKQQLALECPDLLITAIRLGAFNGLQLVLRVRIECGDLPVIVTGTPTDFTSDIDRYGGRFVAADAAGEALLERIEELLAGRTPRDPDSKRRWPRKRAELPATIQDATATVIELSYEGLRFEVEQPTVAGRGALDIHLPTLGLAVKATPRWSRPIDDRESWWCGAEIALGNVDDAQSWRRIVDGLN